MFEEKSQIRSGFSVLFCQTVNVLFTGNEKAGKKPSGLWTGRRRKEVMDAGIRFQPLCPDMKHLLQKAAVKYGIS